MSPVRVVIVDDHPVIRRGVRDILADNPHLEVVAEASSGVEALHTVCEMRPDLVLLDVTLPDRTGIEVLKELKELSPQTKVLVLSIHSEEQYAVRALRAGAAGYLTKESAPEDLLRAIEAVLDGEVFVTDTIARRLTRLTSRRESPEVPHELLSDREFEVLRLLGQGKGISQIAAEMGVSVKTVSTYRARILEKLGKESTAELIRYAVEHNLT